MATPEKIKDWIGGFLKRHKARYNPHDWPADEATEENDVYTRTWLTEFATRHVTKDEADRASASLASTPPNFRREHIPMVVAAVERARAERAPDASSWGTREQARDASLGCAHCGGDGLATAYHPHPSDEDRIARTYAAYCICAHGRWIRRNHAEREPWLGRRIPDLAGVLDGSGAYLAEPPGWRPIASVGAEGGGP